MPQVVAQGGWVSTMADVGGRVREGKPPKLWSNFGHDLKTPATGAVDLSATRIPPGPDYTGGGGFSLPIDLTIYLCLIEFLGRPNQSHAQTKGPRKKHKSKNFMQKIIRSPK